MDRILSAGAAACLKKPLDVTEVRAQVSEAFHLRPMAERSRGGREDAPKVLIVTQNADFRARVKEELSSADPPVEVLTAQTGADAVLVGQSAPPRHVILSLSVPDVDESQAIEKLVAAAGAGGVQILAVHDAPTEDMKAKARAAGARMCLPTAVVTGSVRELLGV
jgi:DNA-binding response OmpR family regulator